MFIAKQAVLRTVYLLAAVASRRVAGVRRYV